MTDYYAQVILILRENGMTKIGSVGKEVLAHMVLAKIENPNATYQEICRVVETKNIIKQMDLKWQKKDIVCKKDGMSDMECCVLYLIEGLELHNEEEEGKKVIEAYIEKIYSEFQKNLYYEEIIEKVKNFGVRPENEGVNLMVAMAYKYRLNPEMSENDMYHYLMDKCKPATVINAIKRAKSIPVEIVDGSNIHQMRPKDSEDIIREEIDRLIMENAEQSWEFSDKKTVREVMDVILKE